MGSDGVGSGNRIVLICRDQSELTIDMSVAPIRDSDNVSIGVVLVFRDITAERSLRSSSLIRRLTTHSRDWSIAMSSSAA